MLVPGTIDEVTEADDGSLIFGVLDDALEPGRTSRSTATRIGGASMGSPPAGSTCGTWRGP